MDLVVEQSCPSCGAPIVLHETDRLIVCPYCDVNNYMVGGGGLRFLLRAGCPAGIDPEDLLYLPYLRFKGCIYQCQGTEVRHAMIDTTRIAIAHDRLPMSLGLRPQAMQLIQGTAAIAGRFVPLQVQPESIFAQAVRLTALFKREESGQVRHRAFIGETVSRVYLPAFEKDDMVVDAVTERGIMEQGHEWEKITATAVPFRRDWEPRFLSTLCPRCGASLHGEADALVLQCRNCETMWEEADGRFAAVEWGRVPGAAAADLALPFWKIMVSRDGGGVLQTYADFLRLTGQPVVIRAEDETRPLAFWIPAFKLQPAAFLQTAHYLTVAQKRLADGEPGSLPTAYPVNLPRREAVQALKSVLAAATLARKRLFPLLPALGLQAAAAALVYLPFEDAGHDLIQRQTGVVIGAAALRFGRKL